MVSTFHSGDEELPNENAEECVSQVLVEIDGIKKGDIDDSSNNPRIEQTIAETEFRVNKTNKSHQTGYEENLQLEVNDQEWGAKNNESIPNQNAELQMFASLKAAQFVDGVLNAGMKRTRLYILEKTSRRIAQVRRSQQRSRAQFVQNQRDVHRTAAAAAAATYFREE